MTLEKYQREQLQNVLASPDFKAVEFFLTELAREIGVAPIMSDSQWNFDKGALQKEYQIALLNQLPNLMEQVAADGGQDA